jgi:hypothetical protein
MWEKKLQMIWFLNKKSFSFFHNSKTVNTSLLITLIIGKSEIKTSLFRPKN